MTDLSKFNEIQRERDNREPMNMRDYANKVLRGPEPTLEGEELFLYMMEQMRVKRIKRGE